MFPLNDALDYILLGGFFFGLIFTVASLLLGFADIGAEHDIGHGHDSDADHGVFHGLINVSTLLAFITWMGGIGYLGRHALGLWSWLAVLLGIAGGVVGAAVIAMFFAKVLRSDDQVMNPADWDINGQLARVSSTIRPGSVGEVGFEMHGGRHFSPARTLGDAPIDRETEVVIIRTEKGVAVVRPFAEMMAERE